MRAQKVVGFSFVALAGYYHTKDLAGGSLPLMETLFLQVPLDWDRSPHRPTKILYFFF